MLENLVTKTATVNSANAGKDKGHGLQILTPQQMLSRPPISLAQLKAGNNSQKLKNEIRKLLYSLYRSKKSIYEYYYLKMEKIFMKILKSKTNESNKFIYQFPDKLKLKNPNKNMTLANLSIYYTWKNIKSEYNNKEFKISAPAWNYKFDLPHGSYSVSDIQDYFEYLIKKHETVADNPPVQIYVNKTKNRIVFKIKTGYK